MISYEDALATLANALSRQQTSEMLARNLVAVRRDALIVVLRELEREK